MDFLNSDSPIDDLTGDYEAARTDYNTLLKKDPTDAIMWEQLGLTLFALGSYEDCINSYLRCI